MLFTHLLPYKTALEINKYEKQYRSYKDMFYTIADEESLADFNPNLETNIIVAVPDAQNLLARNESGGLSIKAVEMMNLTGCRTYNDNTVIKEFSPHIKMSVPKGIRPTFEIPETMNYCPAIYPFILKQKRCSTDSDIPECIVYNLSSFTIYYDLIQLRRVHNTIAIKEGTRLVDIYFTPVYYVGDHSFPMLENIYLVKNTEYLRNFDSIV